MTVRGKIRISRDICKGCGYCIDTCPAGVIGEGRGFNRLGYFPATVLHPEKCTGCGMCYRVCPEIAIRVSRENGKKA